MSICICRNKNKDPGTSYEHLCAKKKHNRSIHFALWEYKKCCKGVFANEIPNLKLLVFEKIVLHEFWNITNMTQRQVRHRIKLTSPSTEVNKIKATLFLTPEKSVCVCGFSADFFFSLRLLIQVTSQSRPNFIIAKYYIIDLPLTIMEIPYVYFIKWTCTWSELRNFM